MIALKYVLSSHERSQHYIGVQRDARGRAAAPTHSGAAGASRPAQGSVVVLIGAFHDENSAPGVSGHHKASRLPASAYELPAIDEGRVAQ